MSTSKKVSIIIAIISALGVIIAALIGLIDKGSSDGDNNRGTGNTVSINNSSVGGDIAGGDINK